MTVSRPIFKRAAEGRCRNSMACTFNQIQAALRKHCQPSGRSSRATMRCSSLGTIGATCAVHSAAPRTVSRNDRSKGKRQPDYHRRTRKFFASSESLSFEYRRESLGDPIESDRMEATSVLPLPLMANKLFGRSQQFTMEVPKWQKVL